MKKRWLVRLVALLCLSPALALLGAWGWNTWQSWRCEAVQHRATSWLIEEVIPANGVEVRDAFAPPPSWGTAFISVVLRTNAGKEIRLSLRIEAAVLGSPQVRSLTASIIGVHEGPVVRLPVAAFGKPLDLRAVLP